MPDIPHRDTSIVESGSRIRLSGDLNEECSANTVDAREPLAPLLSRGLGERRLLALIGEGPGHKQSAARLELRGRGRRPRDSPFFARTAAALQDVIVAADAVVR